MDKYSAENSESDDEDDIPNSKLEDKRLGKKTLATRDNHCEIERKRREKMVSYIFELRDAIPACKALICTKNKPDKITILQMAADHLKTLGVGNTTTAKNYKPSFLTEEELKHLTLEAADGFLFIVNDTGVITYVTESIASVLNIPQKDWLEGCIYSKVHDDDIDIIKLQLSSKESQKPDWLLDLKSGYMKKEKHRSNINCRRNFICRMKTGCLDIKHRDRTDKKNCLGPSKDGKDYIVVHCTGYLRKSSQIKINSSSNNSTNFLVAIGRLQFNSTPNISDLTPKTQIEFLSKTSIDGVFIFIDQRIINVLGYLPNDLLGKCCYDFFHPDDKTHIQESYKQVLNLKGHLMTVVGRFMTNNFKWISLRISMHAFTNPWSDEIEFIMSTYSKPFNSECNARELSTTKSKTYQIYEQKYLDGNQNITKMHNGLQKQISKSNNVYIPEINNGYGLQEFDLLNDLNNICEESPTNQTSLLCNGSDFDNLMQPKDKYIGENIRGTMQSILGFQNLNISKDSTNKEIQINPTDDQIFNQQKYLQDNENIFGNISIDSNQKLQAKHSKSFYNGTEEIDPTNSNREQSYNRQKYLQSNQNIFEDISVDTINQKLSKNQHSNLQEATISGNEILNEVEYQMYLANIEQPIEQRVLQNLEVSKSDASYILQNSTKPFLSKSQNDYTYQPLVYDSTTNKEPVISETFTSPTNWRHATSVLSNSTYRAINNTYHETNISQGADTPIWEWQNDSQCLKRHFNQKGAPRLSENLMYGSDAGKKDQNQDFSDLINIINHTSNNDTIFDNFTIFDNTF